MQAKKSRSSQAFQCHPTPADGLSYKSNWLILYTACYLHCFSLPTVPLCLQATLQPNPVPPFYTISDLYLFIVCSVLNRGIAAAFPASVLCTYMHKEEGEEPKYKLLQMDITVYFWLKWSWLSWCFSIYMHQPRDRLSFWTTCSIYAPVSVQWFGEKAWCPYFQFFM